MLTSVQADRITLLVGCGIATLVLAPLSRMPRYATAPSVTFPRWSNAFLRRFLPAMAVWCLVTGAFPQFATVFFVHHLGLSLERMGSIFSISQLVPVHSAILCGAVALPPFWDTFRHHAYAICDSRFAGFAGPFA